MEDIKQTIIFEAPIQKVWDAVATWRGIASWFMANDFQPKEGQEFHLQSPFGPSPCKVLELDAPHELTFSWDTDGWKISFMLKDLGDKTEFTLIHSGWKENDALLPKANEKASIIRDRMNQGWEDLVQGGLKKIVEG